MTWCLTYRSIRRYCRSDDFFSTQIHHNNLINLFWWFHILPIAITSAFLRNIPSFCVMSSKEMLSVGDTWSSPFVMSGYWSLNIAFLSESSIWRRSRASLLNSGFRNVMSPEKVCTTCKFFSWSSTPMRDFLSSATSYLSWISNSNNVSSHSTWRLVPVESTTGSCGSVWR